MKKGVLVGIAAVAVGVVVYSLSKKEKQSSLPKEFRFYDYKFIFHINGEVEIKVRDEHSKEHKTDIEELLILLAQTESKHLSGYSPSFVALYRTFRFCNILAERCALGEV